MYVFNEEQNNLRKIVKEFVNEEIENEANLRNSKNQIDKEFLQKVGKVGYMGMIAPEQYGGSQMDVMSSIIILNEISQSDVSLGHIISATNYTYCYPLSIFGTEEQKKLYLEPCASGKKFGTLACSESTVECNTIFEEVEDGKFCLNGVKSFVSGGKIADYVIVMATSSKESLEFNRLTFFIIDIKNTPGIQVGKEQETMGLSNIGLVEIVFTDVILSEKNVLGEIGAGIKVLLGFANVMRLGSSTIALSLAQRAYKEALEYMKVRTIDSTPIIEMQHIKYQLAEMKADLEIMELANYTVANNIQNNNGNVAEQSSIVKLFISEKAKEICDKSLQMFGGYGYIRGNTIERLYRDVRAMTIIGGHSEKIKEIICKFM